MASDFTVIQAVRQRFGAPSDATREFPVDWNASFVGQSKQFPFACPNVVSTEWAILQFETVGVDSGSLGRDDPLRQNPSTAIIRINGVDIPGGIKAGPTYKFDNQYYPIWKSHALLVPQNTLKEQNVLHIEAVTIGFGAIDEFVLDNVFVQFKTASGLRVIDPR